MAEPWQTLLAIDFDKWAATTYAANFPGIDVRCASVADLLDSLPCADVVIGGPPCQPHSLAGRRQASADARDCGPDFVAAVERAQPRMFLMENVPGLLSSEGGRYVQRLFASLEAVGYVVENRTLDAVNFGVPQFRNRVWFWGIRRDLYAAGVRHRWPVPTHAWPPPEPCMFGASLLPGVTVGRALDITGDIYRHRGGGWGERPNFTTAEPSMTVLGNGNGDGGSSGAMYLKSHADPPPAVDQPSPILRAGGAGHDGCRITLYRRNPNPESRQEISIDEPCSSILAQKCGDMELRVWGGGRNHPADENGEYRREKRDITDEPSTTIAGFNGATTPFVAIRAERGEGMNERHGQRPDSPLTAPSPTVRSSSQGSGCRLSIITDAQPYHWSDVMLEKHPPASPASPAPTVQAKWFKGGAEGLLALNAIWKQKGDLWVRRLTPLERARLQSVPDSFVWPEELSKTNAYRIIGNGWACGMAAAMSRALAAADPDSRTLIDLFCGGGLGAAGWHQRYWQCEPATAGKEGAT